MTGIGRFARKKSTTDTKTAKPTKESTQPNEGPHPEAISQGFGALGSRPTTGNSDFFQFNMNQPAMQFDFAAPVPDSVTTDIQNGDDVSKVTNFEDGTNFDIGNLGVNDHAFGNFSTDPQGSNVFDSEDFSYNFQNENSFNSEVLLDTSQLTPQNESFIDESSMLKENEGTNSPVDGTPTAKGGLSFAQKMKLRKQEQELKKTQDKENKEVKQRLQNDPKDTVQQHEESTELNVTDEGDTKENNPSPEPSIQENSDSSSIPRDRDNNQEKLYDPTADFIEAVQTIDPPVQNEKAANPVDFKTANGLISFTSTDQKDVNESNSTEETYEVNATSSSPIKNFINSEAEKLTQQTSNIQKSSPSSNIENMLQNEKSIAKEVRKENKKNEDDIKLIEGAMDMISKLQDKINGNEKHIEKVQSPHDIKFRKEPDEKGFDTNIKKNATLSSYSQQESNATEEETFDVDDDDDILDVTPQSGQIYNKAASGTPFESETKPNLVMKTNVQSSTETSKESNVLVQGNLKEDIDKSTEKKSVECLEDPDPKLNAEFNSKKENEDRYHNISRSSYHNIGLESKSDSSQLASHLHTQNNATKIERFRINENKASMDLKIRQSKPFVENRLHLMQKERKSILDNKRPTVESYQNQIERKEPHTPPRPTLVKKTPSTVTITKHTGQEKSNEEFKKENKLGNGSRSPLFCKEVTTIDQNESRRGSESLKTPVTKKLTEKPVQQRADQQKIHLNTESSKLTHNHMNHIHEERHVDASVHQNQGRTVLGNKRKYDAENLVLCQDMNYEKSKAVDSNASFDVLFKKFLKDLRDSRDMLDKNDSEMLEMNLQLSHAHSIGLKYLGDMVDLFEEVNQIISTGNECISMI